MSSLPIETSTFIPAASPCSEGSLVLPGELETTWGSTADSLQPDELCMSFPLSQPDLPLREHEASASASVQRKRRSAACCSTPYIALGHRLIGPLCSVLGSGMRRQHTPPCHQRCSMETHPAVSCEDDLSTAKETERVARELADAAIASACSLAADAKAVDPAYATKPTAFLYKGHTAQIATSTAGMYGEMIESFIKQVVAYARQYGADQFSVFCDLGSGRGAPSAIAAYEHDWLACLGVEKCPQAFGLSLETQRCLLLREASDRLRSLKDSSGSFSPLEGRSGVSQELEELFHSRPMRAVAFAHDDLSAFANLDGVTHAYSFDAAMEGPLINYITQMFMETETWWFYVSFRNDLISRFDLKGAEIKHQISSSMWVSSEGRTAYVYVKTDWKERQRKHRQWLREKLLAPQLHQQAKQQLLLRHVRIQQQLVLQQLQWEDDQLASTPGRTAFPDALTGCTKSPMRTPRTNRLSSLSPIGTPRCRSSSRKRHGAAGDSQQKQQQMVLFHLAARRQQLQVLTQLEPEQSIWGEPQQHQHRDQQQQQGQAESEAASDQALLQQLRHFRSTHLRLSKWHQPLTVRSLLLVSLLPFEGQNQWLQLQQQLLQLAVGVLTRAQRLLLLGYDENQRREEELQRDRWLEQLAASVGAKETEALREDLRIRLTEQRKEDMSLFSFLPPDESSDAPSSGASALPDGASLRLYFRHSLQELQERQSPMRTPRGRSSYSPMALKESSSVGRTVLFGGAATVDAAGALQHLQRQPLRSPVRQAARRRTSNHSVSSITPRRRCNAGVASAALAAADAASSPVKPGGRACAAVATPNGRRSIHRVEAGLRNLAFSGKQAGCDSCIAPMSQP